VDRRGTREGDTVSQPDGPPVGPPPVDVVCLWKSRTEVASSTVRRYPSEYVLTLRNELVRWFPADQYQFHVITDDAGSLSLPEYRDADSRYPPAFVHSSAALLPGSWALLDVFRRFTRGPTLYLDLGVHVCQCPSVLLAVVREHLAPLDVLLSLPFDGRAKRIADWTTAVMAWNGDFSYLESEFRPPYADIYADVSEWIVRKLKDRDAWIRPVGNFCNLLSYEWHCNGFREGSSPPENTHFVLFEGRYWKHSEGDQYWIGEKPETVESVIRCAGV